MLAAALLPHIARRVVDSSVVWYNPVCPDFAVPICYSCRLLPFLEFNVASRAFFARPYRCPATGRHTRRRSVAHHCRRRLRQDARYHPSGCSPAFCWSAPAFHPRHHLHQQSRERDEEPGVNPPRLPTPRFRSPRPALAAHLHLPLPWPPHPQTLCFPPRPESQLHDLRYGRSTATHQAGH